MVLQPPARNARCGALQLITMFATIKHKHEALRRIGILCWNKIMKVSLFWRVCVYPFTCDYRKLSAQFRHREKCSSQEFICLNALWIQFPLPSHLSLCHRFLTKIHQILYEKFFKYDDCLHNISCLDFEFHRMMLYLNSRCFGCKFCTWNLRWCNSRHRREREWEKIIIYKICIYFFTSSTSEQFWSIPSIFAVS